MSPERWIRSSEKREQKLGQHCILGRVYQELQGRIDDLYEVWIYNNYNVITLEKQNLYRFGKRMFKWWTIFYLPILLN